MSAVEVAERIAKASGVLTPAERRVAEVVLEHPQVVAFGTVAELADRAASGAATVVRLASKLGYDGFTGLQASVQHALAVQLRPAAERIREPAGSDAIGRHLQAEVDNVHNTLHAVNAAALADVVDRLAQARRVLLLSGDASGGVARQMLTELRSLRDGVDIIDGNDVAVQRAVALLEATDVVLAIDLRRYDRWVVEAVTAASATGAFVVAFTDSLLSPLAGVAAHTFTIAAAAAGPFDSHVGTLALANLVVALLADKVRPTATERFDRTEAAWRGARSLTDR